jgi:GMP synthase PP-ATPase subunit
VTLEEAARICLRERRNVQLTRKGWKLYHVLITPTTIVGIDPKTRRYAVSLGLKPRDILARDWEEVPLSPTKETSVEQPSPSQPDRGGEGG